MPVRKTVQKKPATKATTKQTSSVKVAEVKKPTVIVETKKTDRCECNENCNCGSNCNCCCRLKVFVFILIIVNLIISCISCMRLCSKQDTPTKADRSAWDLEALKVGGEENLQKLKDELYSSEAYIQAQRESIEAYLQQLGIE